MAAESSSPANADPVYGAVLELLGAAVALSNLATKIHQDDTPSRILLQHLELASTAWQLTKSLDRLGPVRADAANPSATAGLDDSCRRFGQDLLLRLERIEKAKTGGSGTEDQPPSLDAVALRDLWSLEDVTALRRRISELLRQATAELGPADLPDWKAQDPLADKLEGEGSNDAATTTTDVNPGNTEAPSPKDGAKELFSKAKSARAAPTVSVNILCDFVLENLAYKSMFDREEEITKAHAQTLRWIFQERPSVDRYKTAASQNLITFFHKDDLGPIFWITGKPGSGKSTMTQYLFQHQAVMTLLQAWAGDSKVSKAGFFFWTSGSRDQRSQTGLLRSLLYQLLSDNLELMPKTFPQLWEKLAKSTTKERITMVLEWSLDELMAAFKAFLKAATARKTKICLFIDGLDEFEGDHGAMIDFLREISAGRDVKLCISSRPWAVFSSAFENSVAQLRVQHVTQDDMLQYATDRLRSSRHIPQAVDAKSSTKIVLHLIEKADGVFLWTRLAVDRICDTFEPGSDRGDILRLVDSLPQDLEALFTKLIFEDQTASQLAETATLFQLIRAREVAADFVRDESSNSLTCWELIFAIDDRHDKHALEWEVEKVGIESIRELCGELAYKVLKRFAGLLTLHPQRRGGNLATTREAALAERRVTYVHRTVRDWLMEGAGVYDRLTSQAPAAFDPHLNLLRSYVLRLKRPVDEVEHHRRLDDWWPDIALAMTHARHASQGTQHGLQRQFVNEMDRTLSWYWRAKPGDPYDHWARNAFGTYEVRMKAAPIWQPFLCLATKFGLTRYVCEEVAARIRGEADQSFDNEKLADMAKTAPLLSYATEYLCSRNKTIYPLSDPQLVRGLLHLLDQPSHTNRGPNHEYLDFEAGKPRTAWLAVLRHLRTADRRGWISYYDVDPRGVPRWAEIVRLMVEEGGADVRAVVAKDAWDPEITALGVIELLETKYGSNEVRKLRELMTKKMEVDG